MAKISRFEDIEVWKKARALRREIYLQTKTGDFAKDFELKNQIRRAALSITANIAEGFERGGNREFIQFLAVAKGSCGEVRDQLYAVLEEHYVSQESCDKIYADTVEVSRMISGFMAYLQKSDLRGTKYKPSEEQ